MKWELVPLGDEPPRCGMTADRAPTNEQILLAVLVRRIIRDTGRPIVIDQHELVEVDPDAVTILLDQSRRTYAINYRLPPDDEPAGTSTISQLLALPAHVVDPPR